MEYSTLRFLLLLLRREGGWCQGTLLPSNPNLFNSQQRVGVCFKGFHISARRLELLLLNRVFGGLPGPSFFVLPLLCVSTFITLQWGVKFRWEFNALRNLDWGSALVLYIIIQRGGREERHKSDGCARRWMGAADSGRADVQQMIPQRG